MAEFEPVLMIAVVAFVILLLAFNTSYSYMSGWDDWGGTGSGSRPSPDRTVEFTDFEVYYTASEDKAGHLEGETSAGVFSSTDKTAGFQVSNPGMASEVMVVLNTIDTNYYGKIVVLVNGVQVYADYAPIGEQTISFDKGLLRENNVIKIVSESSGWRIWAPTVYRFSADVVVNYYGRKSVEYVFNVTSAEKNRLQKARINVFGNREGVGNLDIKVNGVRIFSGVTTVYKDFAASVIKQDNNTIEFSTQANTKYEISSAQVILFFD